MKRKKGFYSISVVAKMFSVHQQTVRLYEKEGLITPKRTEGNTRLFSEEDVDRLEEIIHLTHTLGVNLAGVEMILKLQKKIKKLQDDMNKLFDQTQHTMTDETEKLKVSAREQTTRLVAMKQATTKKKLEIPSTLSSDDDDEEQKSDDWKIDYDE
jgi:MerR family transcriptional regulator/heat shock protein HspR